MDIEKLNKPPFKIDEERFEKFLKEMPKEVKEGIKSFDKSNAWLMILLMTFLLRRMTLNAMKRSDIM